MIFATIYLIVANPDYEKCPLSELVVAAFTQKYEDDTEPIYYFDQIRTTRLYFDNRDLKIINRDEAELGSDAELPMWKFDRYPPQSFVRENGPPKHAIFSDPLTTIQHIKYLHQLHELMRRINRDVTYDDLIHEVFEYRIEAGGTTTSFYRNKCKYEIAPRSPLLDFGNRWERTTTRLRGRHIYITEHQHIIPSTLTQNQVLTILDMGTGILDLDHNSEHSYGEVPQ